MRAVIYTRASLDRTGEGKSNARQTSECLRLVEYKRWELIRVGDADSLDDVSISAYGTADRPAWNRVLQMIEDGEVDVVVAWHLDRLTRNMADLEKLILLCEKHGVSVATATGDIDLTNDTGRMVARILAAVARQEVERKAARQRLAHAQRRAEGRPWAGVKMLGYERDGTIIEDEAQAIRDAVNAVLDETDSLAGIGRRWSELGLTSPYQKDGSVWSPRGVRQVLMNPRIAGLITHNDEVLGAGNWEPIVPESDLTLVTAKLTDPDRGRGSKSGRRAENLLTGIMRCGKCDGTVRGGKQRGEDVYMCGSWHAYVARGEADDLVRGAFATAVMTASAGTVLAAGKASVDTADVADQIETLRSRLSVLARSFARGLTPEDAYEAAVSEIGAEIAALEASATSSGDAVDWGAVRLGSVQTFLEQPLAEQRKILQRLAVVTVHQAGRSGRGARWQVSVDVRATRAGKEVLIPAHRAEVLAATG